MATVAPAADQASDLLQKLSLDSQSKTLEDPEALKKPSAKYGPVDSGEVKNDPTSLSERSTPTPPFLQEFMDPSLWYVPNGYTSYYCGGYEGPINEWEDYPRYVNTDGVEMPAGVYGDNGSLMYHHGYGYTPYGAYPPPGSPVPAMGHDSQLYGPQHYQYPASYYQPPTPTNTSNQVSSTKEEVSTSVSTDQVPVSVEKANGTTNGVSNGNVNGNNRGPVPVRPVYPNLAANSNGSYGRGILPGGIPPAGYQDPRFGFDGMRSPIPWLDGPGYSDGLPRPITSSSVSSAASPVSNISSTRNQNIRPPPHLMGLHPPRPAPGVGPVPGYMNRMYSNNRIYNCGSPVRTGPGFAPNGYDSRANGRGWMYVDKKYGRSRGRGNGSNVYGNENSDGLDEKHRGPRSEPKNSKVSGPHVVFSVKGQNLPSNGNSVEFTPHPDGELYNKEDFPVKYGEAKFFVIKSYSEDDVHKSIKYSVWASTPSGNKKLDAAYQEAKEKSADCPVFLFFSVNTSGQFVGLAEMVGPVDFNKTLDYWQQDKWNGCFPLKWHIIKDVPNSSLKHITLVNNDNKPVTNSRDTQEVHLEQGLEMLKIFKEHNSKVCILDDFAFYEGRQKLLQERKLKQQQFQKQIWDGKPADGFTDEKVKLQKPLESGLALVDRKLSDNGVVVVSDAGDAPNGAKPVMEKRAVVNGVA